MRIEKKIVVDAPREEVWELVSDPANWRSLMGAGLAQMEHRGGPETGLGARYELRMSAGSAAVGGLIEFVEWDPPGEFAWTSVTGIDQRGRWRLRESDDGVSTTVTLRFSYTAPGGLFGVIADRLGAPTVSGHLERALLNLKREIEGDTVSDTTSGRIKQALTGVPKRVMHDAGSVAILAQAGVVRPLRPDKLARIGLTVMRWGRTPAAGYRSQAVRHPDKTAIIDELGTLTFADVQSRTNAIAHGFADAGIKEGDGIAIMCRNHRYFIDATVAASKLGADALYLNTAFAGPQLTEVVQREKPAAIVYDEEFEELLEEAATRRKRFIGWHDSEDTKDPTLDDLLADNEDEEPVAPEREARAVILTSGTTGTPKGASRGQPQSLDPAAALFSKIPIKAGEKVHIAAPLFHSWGFAHFTLGLLLGTTLVLRRKFDPEQALAEIERHKCSTLVVVPVMMSRILELDKEVRQKYDTSSLKVVAASGSALPGDLATEWMDEFGDNLYNLYGSTEVAWASIATPADMRAAPGTAGRAPRGTILKLLDEKGVEVPTGETGRIFVANEMMFEGYTGDEGESKEVVDGLMSTGDVGRLDEAGRLFVEGRDDEMIVSGGENVFPKEVEDLLTRHESVAEAAAVGVEDDKFGQRLRAFVVPSGSNKPSEDDLKGYIKKNLANYKVPREIWFIDELPRNATGKVLKRELAEMEEAPK